MLTETHVSSDSMRLPRMRLEGIRQVMPLLDTSHMELWT